MSEISDMVNQGFDWVNDSVGAKVESHSELIDAAGNTYITNDGLDSFVITDEIMDAIPTQRDDDFVLGRDNVVDGTTKDFVCKGIGSMREGEHVTAADEQGAIDNITPSPSGHTYRVSVKIWQR